MMPGAKIIGAYREDVSIRQIPLERDPIRPNCLDGDNLAIGLDQRAGDRIGPAGSHMVSAPGFSLPVAAECFQWKPHSASSALSLLLIHASIGNLASTPRARKEASRVAEEARSAWA
jgi:hypothetical protein